MITTFETRPGALGTHRCEAAMSEVAGIVGRAPRGRAVIRAATAAQWTTQLVAARTARDVTDLGTSTKVTEPARSGPM